MSGLVRDSLAESGHDVSWAGDWPEDPGDEEILARARAEKRVLVTLDKDFGELAVVRGLPHAGIVRLVDLSLRVQAESCLRVLELHGSEIERGGIATAEPGRLRVRPAEET
jgi:predicted nuclease of predicted toxin-antitoxin system